MRLLSWCLVAASLSLLGCGDSPPDDSGMDSGSQDRDGAADSGAPVEDAEVTDAADADAGPCVPSASAFETNALPVIKHRCASCHAEEPQFGAPFSLLQYAPLVQEGGAGTIAERMVNALASGFMPPANSPQLSHGEQDTLLSWASCGKTHADATQGLVVSRPVFSAPEDPPAQTEPVELLADGFMVEPTTVDFYYKTAFAKVVEKDHLIRRIEAVVDDSRVVHHLTLRASGSESPTAYVYAWAPGGKALQFDDGGIRIRPGDTLLLEIHYNNGAGVGGVRDSSGVRLWLGPVEGTEYGVANPATWSISVPPGGETSAEQECTVDQDARILAAFPHMHEVGSTLTHNVHHPDGSQTSLIELSGWSFDAQQTYEVGLEVHPGDRMHLECGYFNTTDQTVVAGPNTNDEMCIDFLYVTPPKALEPCHDPIGLL